MNRFLTCITAALFMLTGALNVLHASPAEKLPEPPYKEVMDDPDSPLVKLATLLKEGKTRQFYKDASPLLREIYARRDDEPTEESFRNDLWLCYLLASAPLLTVDGPEPTLYYGDSSDYMTKWSTLQVVYHHDVDKLSKQFKINRRELTKLLASYAAGIMRGYYDNYDPYFNEKDKELRKKRWEEKITDGEQEFNSRQIHLSSRSNSAGHKLRGLEPGFVRKLLTYFPGNANEIRKYARKAGYKEDELAELFELTVGHSKKTDFLYKGLPKPRKDRKPEDVPRDIALPRRGIEHCGRESVPGTIHLIR